MTYEWTGETDMGLGIAVAMLIVAALGAAMMIGGALDRTAAWGFAIVIIAGSIAVWALHAFVE